MGVATTMTVRTAAEFEAGVSRARAEAGPWVIVAKVAESVPAHKPPLDCVFIKQRFMSAIGNPESATSGALIPET
jgi:hypothetical protein